MNKFEDIITRLKALPVKREMSGLLGKFKQYRSHSEKLTSELDGYKDGYRNIRLVFNDANLIKSKDYIIRASGIASRLLENIDGDKKNIATQKWDSSFAQMKENIQSANKILKDYWIQLINQRFESFKSLSKVARGVDLPGAKQLEEQVARIARNTENLPSNKQHAKGIKNDLSKLVSLVAELGLEGKPGEFLIAAARGEANLKDVELPEVRNIIERYKLWRLLKVKFV